MRILDGAAPLAVPAGPGDRSGAYGAGRQHVEPEVEDYVLEPPRAPGQPRLRVKTEEHAETRQVKQPGLWGTVKRPLGRPFGADWGYDTRTYKRTQLDCTNFRRRVEEAVRGQLSWASDARSRVVKVVRARLATLADEMKRQQAAIQQQLTSAAKDDERRQAVRRLEALAEAVSRRMASLLPDVEVEASDCLGIRDETAIIEVPKFVEALALLTDRYLRRRFVVLRDSVLAQVGERRKGADRRALLWSFEADSLERFLTRFWFDVLRGPLAPESVLELIRDAGPFKAIGVGKELADGNKPHSLRAQAKQFLGKASTLFLLLDAQQPGSTKSQLARSQILPLLKHVGGLVVVVQSLKGLDIAESLYELTRITTEFGLRADAYLANDDELMLSVLIDRLAMDGERLQSQRDEMRWLGEFEFFFSQEQRDRCAKILRDWREMSRSTRERFHG